MKYILVFLFIILSSHLLYGQIDLDRDPYEVLGIERTANPETIKKAYLEKAKEVHPDRNQNSEESTRKFQELTSAYHEIINDFNTRSHTSQERSNSTESTEQFDHIDEMFAASARDDTETLRNLIVQGVNINAKDVFGNTPLHIAAQTQSLKSLAFLMEMGAVSTQNSNGRTFVDILTAHDGVSGKAFTDPEWNNRDKPTNEETDRTSRTSENLVDGDMNRTPRTPENLAKLSTLELIRLYFTEVGRSIKKRVECLY